MQTLYEKPFYPTTRHINKCRRVCSTYKSITLYTLCSQLLNSAAFNLAIFREYDLFFGARPASNIRPEVSLQLEDLRITAAYIVEKNQLEKNHCIL